MADNPPKRERTSYTPRKARAGTATAEPNTEATTERSMPEDKPPVRERVQPRATAADVPGKPIKVLQNRLERFFVGMALPFAAAGDMQCAKVLIDRGPVVAEAWANLAAESPAVKKVLESLLKGGAWAGAISSTLALVVPIAAHHGAPIPDFASAVMFGNTSQASQTSHDREPIVTPAPNQSASSPVTGSGGSAPGPAAVSLPSTGRNGAGPGTDPAQYPGAHNSKLD